MEKIDLERIKRVHVVGIGGIGVSAVARMFLDEGKEVSGSDAARSRVTEELEKLGLDVSYGHEGERITADIDLVVHTVAASEDNPELVRARELGISTISYPQALGIISRSYKTIAVAGTHGKTTTTAMVVSALRAAGVNPTVIVGSLLKDTNSNYVKGSGEYLVVEADEYRRAFAHYAPQVLVITNIDFDHPDYFKDLNDVQDAFRDLVRQVQPQGEIVADPDDPHLALVLEGVETQVADYKEYLSAVPELKVAGEHNRKNAAAALAVASVLSLDIDKAKEGLESFEGLWRRFEYRGVSRTGAIIYDDYAHNPQKVRALIEGARAAYPDKEVHLVFQPHTFSRTQALLEEFADALSTADRVVLLPIYGAREKEEDFGFNSEVLLQEIDQRGGSAELTKSFAEAVESVADETDDALIIAAGAGDVYKVSEKLVV